MERLTRLVSEKPVVIFSKSSCCMCHTIKSLLCDFGVNPTVYELDEIPRGREIEQTLSKIGCSPTVPAVFIGGQLIGGANEVMSAHLNRSLIPMLKRAGALWIACMVRSVKTALRSDWDTVDTRSGRPIPITVSSYTSPAGIKL